MQHASEKIAKRYARALFELAAPTTFDQLSAGLVAFANSFESSDPLRQVLANPSVPQRARAGIVSDVAKRLVPNDQQLQDFFGVLYENGRLELIRSVAREFAKLVHEFKKSLSFEITTPGPLAADEQQSILNTLQSNLGREVSVEWKINPELLGGMQLKMGDRLLDGSVDGQLKRLYATIINEGRAE